MTNTPDQELGIRKVHDWMASADGCLRQALALAQHLGDDRLEQQVHWALENLDLRINALGKRALELGVNLQ